jgi:hypothetical protein
MGNNQLSVPETQPKNLPEAGKATYLFPTRAMKITAGIVYGASAVGTVLVMLKANAPLQTVKDFIGWLLAFLMVTFAAWLVAFFLLFIFVKYKSRAE